MSDTPVTFESWLKTNPKDWNDRREAGEAGNKQNPIFMSRYAFDAGVHAGLEIASRRLKEVILDRKIDWDV